MGIETAATAAWMAEAASAAATVVGTAMVTKAMTPNVKTPEVKPTLAMPDPLAQEAARKREIAETMSRRGRASTIMTQPSGTLGG